MSKRITGRVLAKYMHNAYERRAAKKGWSTQKKCRTDFDKLPEANKETMLAVAKDVLRFIREHRKD